ncbi:hypothetical protein [Roseomonas sp. BN140053]|uniref:hypothetical protein n=1 Tax=Roseomonas sp. BN140053 TaxID=3391898 RepID=UPI0039EB309F
MSAVLQSAALRPEDTIPWRGWPLRHGGALLPLAAMALGLLWPAGAALADRATPLLLAATTLFGVLALPAGGALRTPLRAAALAVALGVFGPLLAGVAATALGAGAERTGWVVLAAAAPVGTGAIGLAAALGLGGARTAAVVLASVASCPVLLPGLAALLQLPGALDPGALAGRLWLMAVLPAVLALPLRRLPRLASGSARGASAALAVLALALTALARMHGVGPVLRADPAAALALLGLACLPVLCGAAVALVLLRGRGGAEAILAGGYRNVTLIWAACAPVLPPEGHLFMALTALPVFATPALAALARRRPGG